MSRQPRGVFICDCHCDGSKGRLAMKCLSSLGDFCLSLKYSGNQQLSLEKPVPRPLTHQKMVRRSDWYPRQLLPCDCVPQTTRTREPQNFCLVVNNIVYRLRAERLIWHSSGWASLKALVQVSMLLVETIEMANVQWQRNNNPMLSTSNQACPASATIGYVFLSRSK